MRKNQTLQQQVDPDLRRQRTERALKENEELDRKVNEEFDVTNLDGLEDEGFIRGDIEPDVKG